MSDLINRLREGCGCNFPETTCMAEDECRDAFEAAAEIERLTAENARLSSALAEAREVIRPFATEGAEISIISPDANGQLLVAIADLRLAVQWLEKNP